MKNLKQLKRINNERTTSDVPKFEIGFNGKKSTGYQAGASVDTSGYTSNSAYDMSNEVSTLRRSQPATAILGIGKNVLGLKEMFSPTNFITQSAADAANITAAKAAGMVAVDDAGNAINMTADAASKALAENGSNVAKSGLTAAGKIMPWLSVASGAYDTFNAASSYSDKLRDQDILNMAGTATSSRNGVKYNEYTGVDTTGINRYTHQQNVLSGINMASGVAGIGAGLSSALLGSELGIWAGPIGMVGGALIGGLTGALLGHNRSKDVEEAQQRALTAMAGQNTQNESEAGSRGLRLADRGIDTKSNVGVGSPTIAHTENGVEPALLFGKAQSGEGVYNVMTGNGHMIPGNPKSRVDNKNVGVSLTDPNPQDTVDNTVIFGNDKWGDKTLKEHAAPWLKILEKGGDSKTDKRNQENARRKLNELAKIQQFVHNSQREMKNIKNQVFPKFDEGKVGINPLWSFAQAIPYALSESIAANKETPWAQNSYVANPAGDAALNIFKNARINPRPQIERAIRAARQGMYNINQAGGMNSALKTALRSSYLNDTQRQIQDILGNTNEQDMKALQAYAAMLGQYGEQAAARQQPALATQQEAYRQAVGAKQKWQAQGRKNWYTTTRQGLLDYNTWDYQDKMVDLYDQSQNLDENKLKWDMQKYYADQNVQRQAALEAAKRADEERRVLARRKSGIYEPFAGTNLLPQYNLESLIKRAANRRGRII